MELDYQIRISSEGSIHRISDQCHIGLYPNEPSIGLMTVNMTVIYILNMTVIYIYVYYIYIMCKINRAQALFQYLIRSYHISSQRHEDCTFYLIASNFDMRLSTNAARQHWALLTAWDACQIFKWNNLASSRLQVMGSGICSSWQGNMSGCVDCLCCYASGSLKWR